MKIMSVVGARPNFMKAAPIIAAIREHNGGIAALNRSREDGAQDVKICHILVHTGQHYDQAMSESFFADLNIPNPDVHLGVGSGSHAGQTAEIMKRFEQVVIQERPDFLIVVGDVNSTLACALVAAKMSFDANGSRPRIVHVEAGLRSFDRSMPEEINRIITDHLADLHFVTEESGVHNLRREGIPDERIHFVGNTMIDSVLAYKDKAESSAILDKLNLRSRSDTAESPNTIARYALLTLHRPSNVDHREKFLEIIRGLEELGSSCRIIFPAHPRTRKKIADFGLARFFGSTVEGERNNGSHSSSHTAGIHVVAPLGYLDFLCLMKHATLVVTDSGGIQEETTCLGIPCVTVRENTERPVTLDRGTNTLAGVGCEGLQQAIQRQLTRPPGHDVPDQWDGMAGKRIIHRLTTEFLKSRENRTAESFMVSER